MWNNIIIVKFIEFNITRLTYYNYINMKNYIIIDKRLALYYVE